MKQAKLLTTVLQKQTQAKLITTVIRIITTAIKITTATKIITDKNSQETAKLNEQHTTIMLAYKDEIKDAINNNTLVMQRLCDTMEVKNTRATKKSKKGEEEKENEA